MRVIEQFVLGKHPVQNRCEDVVVVTDDHAAVIDGVTDRSGRAINGTTGGRAAALRLAEEIHDLPSGITAAAAVNRFTAAVADINGTGIGNDRPAAVTCVYSRARRELWLIGDCQFLLPGAPPAPSPQNLFDETLTAFRVALITARLNSGDTETALRADQQDWEAMLPLLRLQHTFRNRTGPYGHAAIDGTAIPGEFVTVTPVPSDQEQVILATDGYPSLRDTLHSTEEELRNLLRDDPLCVGALRGVRPVRPAHNSFDDRAYLRLDITD